MRILRVSDLKCSKNLRSQSEPREGTKSRKLWDAIHNGPVNVYDFDGNQSATALYRFRDFYGLETIRTGKGIYEIDCTK